MTNEQYYDCIQPYQNACQIMRAKLEVLNGSLYQKSSVSPIHNIQERIKSKKSIEKKLEKLGHSDSVQNAKDHLRDIAGIRVICYFIDDIYNLVNALKRQSELIFIREKDYIQNPKPNGYRSFHVIIAVPVYYLDTMEYFPVEINRADYKMLLRVPGIGYKSAARIVKARRLGSLDFQDIKKMGVVLKRALYFITCGGKMMYPTKIEEDYITRNLLNARERLPEGIDGMNYRQLSLFDDVRFGGKFYEDGLCV